MSFIDQYKNTAFVSFNKYQSDFKKMQLNTNK